MRDPLHRYPAGWNAACTPDQRNGDPAAAVFEAQRSGCNRIMWLETGQDNTNLMTLPASVQVTVTGGRRVCSGAVWNGFTEGGWGPGRCWVPM